MQNNNVLPPDFDGVFRFTNYTDQDFTAKWNNVAYTFPATKTSPMIIPGATPEEVQHIRKKFARELAEQEFAKTDKFKRLNDVPPGGTPALYTESDLTPFIQRCLEPLPLAQAAMKALPRDNDSKFTVDSKGRKVTRVLEKDESLLAGGASALE